MREKKLAIRIFQFLLSSNWLFLETAEKNLDSNMKQKINENKIN